MKRSLRSWLWRVPLDQEVDEEIAFHLEMRTRELVARGMDPQPRATAAARRLGDRRAASNARAWTWQKERPRHAPHPVARRVQRRREVRGAAAAERAGLHAASPPSRSRSASAPTAPSSRWWTRRCCARCRFADPDRLVMIWERTATSRAKRRVAAQHGRLERAQPHVRVDRRLHARASAAWSWPARDGTAETVPRQWVTGGFFDVARREADCRPHVPVRPTTASSANVVVLSEAFWRTRFDADPVVDRTRRPARRDAVHGRRRRAERGSNCSARRSIWALMPDSPAVPRARAAHVLQVVGRLKPGVTLDAASADLSTVADGLAREFPQTNKGRGVRLEPLHDALIGSELRLTSMLFLGVVGFVLLICCANVANLLLARATVRVARAGHPLGARRRPARAHPAAADRKPRARGARRRAGRRGRRGDSARRAVGHSGGAAAGERSRSTFDLRVVAFCAATALMVGVLFGLAPAWQGSEHLGGAGDRLGQPDRHRSRRTAPRTARRRRGRDRRAAALRRRACCCARSSPSTTSIAAIARTAC